MDDEPQGGGYAWEKADKSWENIEEDEDGLLRTEQMSAQRNRKRQQTCVAQSLRRGMIRYLYVIVDLSISMNQIDFKPYRLGMTLAFLKQFITQYFDANPLSQLGLIGTRDATAIKLTDFASNPKSHCDALHEKLVPSGEPSLQLSLEMAKDFFEMVPSYGSREVLVISSCLSTCDPGNIHHTIAKLKKERIRCSAISLSAELFILKELASTCNGGFDVALDKEHFHRKLQAYLTPPPIAKTSSSKPTLLRMGFPPQRLMPAPTLCQDGSFQSVVFSCPRCKSKLPCLPSTCAVCSLPLASSPHLARSYHHLFPIESFEEAKTAVATPVTTAGGSGETAPAQWCRGCLKCLPAESELRLCCPMCESIFCLECDMLLHDTAHNCPGCLAKRQFIQ
jgi:transcription initiation factor TFIIH subunit 2